MTSTASPMVPPTGLTVPETDTTVTTRAAGRSALRETLRGLPVLKGAAPPFDTAQVPADPVELFVQWFHLAVDDGVSEPHAMTLSTVDGHGQPQARVLILKDVTADGRWHFAISSRSRKGQQLAANPVAALTFYWPQLGRQIRLTGRVEQDPRSVAVADFRARPTGSRAMALTRRQSQPYSDPSELDAALRATHAELTATPDAVPEEWTSYAVVADAVEFWQSDPTRRHVRVEYRRHDVNWSHTLLWP